jgi:hypothetical protein
VAEKTQRTAKASDGSAFFSSCPVLPGKAIVVFLQQKTVPDQEGFRITLPSDILTDYSYTPCKVTG